MVNLILLCFTLSLFIIRSQLCGPDCSICTDGGASFCNSDDVNRCTWTGNECIVQQCGPDCSLCDGIGNSAKCNADPICLYLDSNDLCRLRNSCSSNCTLCSNENDCINIGAGGNACLWNHDGSCTPQPRPTPKPTGFPTIDPTPAPSSNPTIFTTRNPTKNPSAFPTSRPHGSDSSEESSESSENDSYLYPSIANPNDDQTGSDTEGNEGTNAALQDHQESSREVEEENEMEIVSQRNNKKQTKMAIVFVFVLFVFLLLITCLVFCAWKLHDRSKKMKNKHSHARIKSVDIDDIHG